MSVYRSLSRHSPLKSTSRLSSTFDGRGGVSFLHPIWAHTLVVEDVVILVTKPRIWIDDDDEGGHKGRGTRKARIPR